jgi:RHS repeat-associated protein
MVTGNLALSLATHSVQSLSGPVGATLTYNSLTADTMTGQVYGLTGRYTQPGGSQACSGAEVGVRTDPGVDFNWTSGSPIGGVQPFNSFQACWTGQITFPALPPGSSWQLGGTSTGTLGISIDGTNYYSQSGPTAQPSYGANLNPAPGPHQIEVDFTYSGTGNNPTVALWANETNVTNGAIVVPSTWLTPKASSLPPGWQLSDDTLSASWSQLDDQGTAVVLTARSGQTAQFTALGGGRFQPPPGSSDLLSLVNGHYQLSTAAGQLYTFNDNGTVSSFTSVADDRQPTALVYTYGGSPLSLTKVTDPVSGQSLAFTYNTSSGSCPAASAAPGGMLCTIGFWDNTTTLLGYDTNGNLAKVIDDWGSVNATTLVSYDTQGRVTDITDPLAFSDGATGTNQATQISYDSAGRVATITQPLPTPGATAAPQRTYNYVTVPPAGASGPGTTNVSVAGFNPASGYEQKVGYDAQGRITAQTDSAGLITTTVWDNLDRPVVKTAPAGLQTTTAYDNTSNVTDTWGPAPASCFSTIAPYQPLTSLPAGTCNLTAAQVPHTHNGYDEGVTSLAASYWSNGQAAGAVTAHNTGLAGTTLPAQCSAGTLCGQWTSPPVGSDTNNQWSLHLLGLISLPGTPGSPENWTFELGSLQTTLLYIDNQLVVSDANPTQGTIWNFATSATQSLTAGTHQIELDYTGSGTENNGLFADWQGPGQTSLAGIPTSALDPNYGLKTSTIDPDGKVSVASYTNPSLGAQYGLPTEVVQDPTPATLTALGMPATSGGLPLARNGANAANLITTTSYQPPGPGSLVQKTATTLPSGNVSGAPAGTGQTTYTYYPPGNSTPLANTCGITNNQAGLLESQTDPAPNGTSGGRLQQFVYNGAGQVEGVQVNGGGWQCTIHDHVGRIKSQTWPQVGSAPARTATYAYSVGGNPLVTDITDQPGVTCTTPTTPGCVSTTVDLLGRVISYTDALGKITTTSYAQDGQVQSTSGPQGTISNGYDPNSGQPTTTALNNVTLSTASYDNAGRLSQVAYANGTTASLAYNSYGNQTSQNYTTGSGQLIDGQNALTSPAGRITSTNSFNGSNYTTITPTRIADTRTNSGKPYAGQHLGAGATLNVQVTAANGDAVPTTATAVVLNVTAVNATTGTYLTVFAAGASRPGVSDLNVATNTVTNNQVTAPVGSGGQVAVFNAAGTLDVVVDVVGYYSPVPTGTAGYNPISPARLADTRTGSGYQDQGQTLASGGSDTVQVTGNAGVPATGVTVSAAVVEVTAVNETAPGYLILHAHGTATPATSNLDYTTNVNITKEVTVALSSSGQFDISNSGASTNAVVDIMGYYTAGSGAQYVPITPTRVADTRTNSGQPYAGQHLTTGANLNVQVTSANGDGVPANATAAVINLTAINSTAAGYLQVYAAGASRPSTTNLSVATNTTVNDEVTAPIGSNGQIAIYDAAGTVDVLVDVEGYFVPNTTTSASYSYDGVGRLTQTALPASTYTYGYGTTTGCPDNNAGANTNRTNLTITGAGAGTTSYCYNNADQLTSTTLNSGTPNTNFNYDPNTGNQTLDNSTTLTWDSANRLATTTNPAGAVTAYTYDPLNRVIQQQDGTTTVRYSYAGTTTSPAAILDNNSNLLDTLVALPGGVTVTVPTAGLAASIWSYTNLQGDTTLTATNTGTPQGTVIAYDPWGTPLAGGTPIANTPAGSPTLASYGAQGKLTDPNNNLITMGARPYNPTEARFLSTDPSSGGCANAYVYSFGDPVNQPDLSGEAGCQNFTPIADPSIALTAAGPINSEICGFLAHRKRGEGGRILFIVPTGDIEGSAQECWQNLTANLEIVGDDPVAGEVTKYGNGGEGVGFYVFRNESEDGTPAIDVYIGNKPRQTIHFEEYVAPTPCDPYLT